MNFLLRFKAGKWGSASQTSRQWVPDTRGQECKLCRIGANQRFWDWLSGFWKPFHESILLPYGTVFINLLVIHAFISGTRSDLAVWCPLLRKVTYQWSDVSSCRPLVAGPWCKMVYGCCWNEQPVSNAFEVYTWDNNNQTLKFFCLFIHVIHNFLQVCLGMCFEH